MNDMTDLLERASDDLLPDVPALVAGGIARGRTLRRRRRLGIAAGALSGVAAVGVGALLVPSYVGGPPSADEVPVTTQPAAPSAPGLPARLTLTLPAGVGPARVTLIRSWGSEAEGFRAAAWTVTPRGGAGAGRVEVLVERTSNPKAPKSCAEDPTPCSRRPDGSYVSGFTAAEPLSGGGDSDIVGAHTSLWTPDGLHVTATAYNALGEKDTRATRKDPVLDQAQLADVVRALAGR
ncbi:MAG: hypothetical protein J7518_17875 [Nocardioidaceae bacterium]|nr:hypothetical protein [Nocardioidaceae bacterium]